MLLLAHLHVLEVEGTFLDGLTVFIVGAHFAAPVSVAHALFKRFNRFKTLNFSGKFLRWGVSFASGRMGRP